MRYLIIFIYFFFYTASSHEYKKAGIEVNHPILKLISEGSKIGAGYLKIVNNTKKEIFLESINSKISKKQEIHNVLIENDTYKMRPVKNGLKILPGEELVFKPKSYHVMFFGINEKYKSEEMLDAKLNFNNDVFINVKFKVLIGNKEHNHH